MSAPHVGITTLGTKSFGPVPMEMLWNMTRATLERYDGYAMAWTNIIRTSKGVLTDCPCDVCCSRLTTCLWYGGPLISNLTCKLQLVCNFNIKCSFAFVYTHARAYVWFSLLILRYRNWYQYWSHCGPVKDMESASQSAGEGRGQNPRAVVSSPGC